MDRITAMKETRPDPIKEYRRKSGLIMCPCIIKFMVSNSKEPKKKYRTIDVQNEVH